MFWRPMMVQPPGTAIFLAEGWDITKRLPAYDDLQDGELLEAGIHFRIDDNMISTLAIEQQVRIVLLPDTEQI